MVTRRSSPIRTILQFNKHESKSAYSQLWSVAMVVIYGK